MVIVLALCPTWQSIFLKILESRRQTKTKDVGETVKGYQKFKALDKAMAAEGKTVVRAEAKAEAAGATMDRSSMEFTSKTSN